MWHCQLLHSIEINAFKSLNIISGWEVRFKYFQIILNKIFFSFVQPRIIRTFRELKNKKQRSIQ